MTFADSAGPLPDFATVPFTLEAEADFLEGYKHSALRDRQLVSLLDEWTANFIQGSFSGLVAGAVDVANRMGPSELIWPRSASEASQAALYMVTAPLNSKLVGREQLIPTQLDFPYLVAVLSFPNGDTRVNVNVYFKGFELTRGSGKLKLFGSFVVGAATVATALMMSPQFEDYTQSWQWEQRIERSIAGEPCYAEGRVTADLTDLRRRTAQHLNIYERNLDAETLRERTCNLQLLLKLNGVWPGAVDGVPGPGTRAAYDHYRREHNLTHEPPHSTVSLGSLLVTLNKPPPS